LPAHFSISYDLKTGRFLRRNRLINRPILYFLKAILANSTRCELSLGGEQLGWPEQTADDIRMKGNHIIP